MGANVRSLVGAITQGGAVATVTTNVDTSGPSNNAHNPPPVLQNVHSYPAFQYVPCGAGDTVVEIPQGVVGVLIYPTSDTNTTAWGIRIHPEDRLNHQNVLGTFQTTFPPTGGTTDLAISVDPAAVTAVVFTLEWF